MILLVQLILIKKKHSETANPVSAYSRAYPQLATHYGICRGLSVANLLLGFRRFSSRRRVPATLTSDDVKIHIFSSTEVLKNLRYDDVKLYLPDNQITWNFINQRSRGAADSGRG